MSAPREVLGPFPPRGLTDYPDRSPYGSAARAENVEFADGWVRPRGGTKLWNTSAPTLNMLDVSRVLLVREFRGRGNSPLLVLVTRTDTGTEFITVSVCTPGVSGSVLAQLSVATPHAGFQPSAVEFNEALYVSLPAGPSGVYWVKVKNAAPYVTKHIYTRDGSGIVDEAGPFFSTGGAGDKLLAQFGVAHNARVWYGGYPESLVRFSAPLYAGLVSSLNEVKADGPATGLASFAKSLVVFTRYSAQLLTEFGGQGDVQVQPFLRTTGAVAHNAIAQAGHRLYFLSDAGLLAMDQAGNIDEVSAAIRRTLRGHQPDFANAQLVHYPAKHQLWLTFPSSQTVYVMGMEKRGSYYDWSTMRLARTETEWASPQCVGLTRTAQGDVPVLGVLSESGEASAIVTQRGEPGDEWYVDPGKIPPPVPYTETPGRFFNARWISHPLMALGHNQPRIFRYYRPTLRDGGDGSTARISWATDGQILDEDYLVGGAQYLDVSAESDEAGSRFGGGAESMSLKVTDWAALSAYGGVKVWVGVLDQTTGLTRVYELTEGWYWSAATSDIHTAASLFSAVTALAGVDYTSGLGTDTILWGAADGYLLTLLSVTEPGGAVSPVGLTPSLATPVGGLEFGDGRFVPGIGESDVQRRSPISGRRRGRRIQIAVQNTESQRIFGLRSFEIDTRRMAGRR